MVRTDTHPHQERAPFTDLKVADLSRKIPGQFCARLFAYYGARVDTYTKAGPRTAMNNEDVLWADPDFAVVASPWLHLGPGYRWRERSRDDLTEGMSKLTDYDIIICTDRSTATQAATDSPRAIVALATDFADEGPYRHWIGNELIFQALSGSMYYNGAPQRKPLYGAGHRASCSAGLFLFTRVVAELIAHARGLSTDHMISVATHEAAAAMEQNFSGQWSYSRTVAQRGELTRPKGRVRCRDGWVVFFAMESRLAELFQAFGCAHLLTDRRFDSWTAFCQNLAAATDEFTNSAKHMRQADLLQFAVRTGLVLSPVQSIGSLLDEECLNQRGFWVRDGKQLAMAPPWRITAREIKPSTSPISTAAHRDNASELRTTTRPLDGIRVTDLTTAWSGPFATRVLALLGARVVKIENPRNLDPWRGPAAQPTMREMYPGCHPGEHPFNRHVWFNSQNLGKKSAVFDLKSEEGKAYAHALFAQSDVLVSNFSPGVLNRLGMGFEDIVRSNPGLVMVEMSGYGTTGPLRTHRAYGQTMEAMSGITSLIGYEEDGVPLGSGSAYVDPIGGLSGAAAALTALYARIRSGCAQHVDLAQREAAMHWIADIIYSSSVNGNTLPSVRGNASPGAFPHDAFPANGNDEWIAIAIHTYEQWRALCDVLGWADWRDDSSFKTVADRRELNQIITDRLTQSTAAAAKSALANALQIAGVPAAPVQNGQNLFEDPQLRYRNWFAEIAHAEAGTHDYPGLPLTKAGRLLQPTGSAPLLGQHTGIVRSHALLPSETPA